MKIRNATPGTPAEALVARNPLARTYSPSKKISLFLFLLAATTAAAQTPSSSPTVPARIEQIAFLAGSWGGPAGGADVEEAWLAPKGGLMLGLGRTVKEGKAVDWEFMRIEEQGGTLVYLASPGGRPATPFPLVALDATGAAFESALEFPRRVSYRKNPDGTLTARIEGVRNGRSAAREWTWRRVETK